jgi:hypothetical protein
MAVCRKFELDLGDKGLIYNLFVQPSVFFRQALKTDGCASRSVCRTLNGPAPCESGADSLRRSLFDFEAITTGQLVQTPDQAQAFKANVHSVFFVPAECEIFGFALPPCLNLRLHPRLFHLFSLARVLDLTFASTFLFRTRKTFIPK